MIFSYLNSVKNKWWQWFVSRAHGTHAKFWLVLFSFSESSFFVVPPDILLIGILMAGADHWVYYASLTTIASVLGGLFGYIIGYFFFDAIGARIIDFYYLTEKFELVKGLYEGNAFWIIFTAAFTPIPYKIFVLSAGFFKINIIAFLMASLLGRSARFFLVAYLTKLFGNKMSLLFLRYFNLITAVAVVVFVFYIITTLI